MKYNQKEGWCTNHRTIRPYIFDISQCNKIKATLQFMISISLALKIQDDRPAEKIKEYFII